MAECKSEPTFENKLYTLTVDDEILMSEATKSNCPSSDQFLFETETGDYLTAEQLRAIADKLDQLSGACNA